MSRKNAWNKEIEKSLRHKKDFFKNPTKGGKHNTKMNEELLTSLRGRGNQLQIA